MQKIQSKYTEYLLAPANAIGSDDVVVTTDGVKCKLVYQSTWNNEGGRFDDRLEDVCQTYYGCPFQTIRSIWISRVGILSEYWHLIKMEKV